MTQPDYDAVLARRAVDQIRDALATLSYAADGFYEDEAQVALDALDWLEAKLTLDDSGAERLGSAP